MIFNMSFTQILVRLPVLLLALSVHEMAHGLAAYKLGDSTAKYDGRLSINPLHHIDPVGLLCMLFFRFGWAKPVMTNPRNFQNPKRDMALTSIAGPLSNFIMAFIAMMIYLPLVVYSDGGRLLNIFIMFAEEAFWLNISLCVFNLLPIPPLDGSKVLAAFLPNKYAYPLIYGGRISFVILILLIYTDVLSVILSPFIMGAYRLILFLVGKIYFFL